jgi:NitT/TauT family transport system substrate-binding protein
LPTPEVAQVKLGILNATTNHDVDVAIEDGLFAKNGLTVTYQVFTSESSMVQALLAGQIDVIGATGVSETIGSQKTNSPLVIGMVMEDNITDNLYTSKNVKTAQDLKGKSIAISSFGSSVYGEALIMVKALGLSSSDVTITPIGDDAARRAALAAGTVAGSLNDRGEAAQMTAAGFNVLLPGSQLTTGLPTGAEITTRAYAQTNPNTVLAVVASLIEGLHSFLTNPADAAQAQAKLWSIDLATATTNVQADLPGWTPQNGRPSLADFQAAQALFVKTDPSLASVDVSQAITTQFVDQLKSLGWYQANGITP